MKNMANHKVQHKQKIDFWNSDILLQIPNEDSTY
jgi:hypothetical protein